MQTPSQVLFNRLSEGEKIELRMASSARQEHMAYNNFRTDLIAVDPQDKLLVVEEVVAMCKLQFANISDRMEFFGASRKYQ